ncbi:MAG: shikimate dehydrogenase [Alistipes sp.]|nr:shikimate dehydrogenase [Alistipes sp.]
MRRYGLIGRSLAHSFSQRYFERKFTLEHIVDAEYGLYELADIADLESLLSTVSDLRGLNVTIPYKQAILPYLDSISLEAKDVGAVNCIDICRGRMTGYNTDVEGIRSTLTALTSGRMPHAALILGSGGASKAVQFVLSQWDIPYSLVSRDSAKGNLTYDELDAEVMRAHDLIVNTTPLGMWPNVTDAPRLPYESLSHKHMIFDLIYNPEQTALMQLASARGAAVAGGMEMLVVQAEASWRIWNRQHLG